MKTKIFFLCLIVLIFSSCKQDYSISKIEGKRLEINDSIKADNTVDAFIKPYRDKVNKDLDSTLAFAVDTYSKTDGELNTAIGNFMADALYEMTNPVFKSRTGKDIDLVLLNHGGIRSIISKGNITSRTAYEVMPFDNTVVVTTLKGEQIKELLTYLASRKRAHPIAGLQVILNADGSINRALIKGSEIDYNKTYYVATSDYLYNGGDRMSFLKSKDSLYDLDYKIRNLLIDYFKKIDTLRPTIDDRFIQLKDK
ncbi:5'-nucleotidase-like protein [Winogradskyella wandonensis]|uniref:5'-nucleotidase-like protein n=1 Tax=Winogradskyella wandonensis TaxID=1442586 RepID=A0A4R1KIV4_9FLAO|nr:5'-nucleotidase C-terminal domain-containing protein [Winogradskyella wandonensis]TCK64714.1 5'-nucleotidase-like protein [Winogradskyella wandonensis]